MNDGAILQAYSQVTALQKQFKNSTVEIIDYRIKSMERMEFKFNFTKALLRLKFSKVKRYVKLKRFVKNNLPLSRDRLISDDYNEAINYLKNRYDVIVVGSDEVWKSICDDSKRPFPNIYWLSPEIKCIKIALAASANRCDFNTIGIKKKEIGRKLLEDFDFIGVRDQHTIDFVKSLGVKNKEILKVPDPTFTYRFNKTDDRIIGKKLKSRGLDLNKPILCYRLGIGGEKGELCRKAKEYFEKKGYQTVSIGGRNQYASIDVGDMFNPFEWARVYKYFDFCITDRFHGSIFCLKNGTPFLAVEDDDYYKVIRSKIVDLLDDFDMLEHYLFLDGSGYDLESILKNIENNFSEKLVKKKVKEMEERYYEVLDKIGKLLWGVSK